MRPEIVQEVAVVVHTTAAVIASVTLYPVTSVPFDAGAVHESVIEPFPKVGVNDVTLDGTVAGTAALDVAASLRPASVIATTENV